MERNQQFEKVELEGLENCLILKDCVFLGKIIGEVNKVKFLEEGEVLVEFKKIELEVLENCLITRGCVFLEEIIGEVEEL